MSIVEALNHAPNGAANADSRSRILEVRPVMARTSEGLIKWLQDIAADTLVGIDDVRGLCLITDAGDGPGESYYEMAAYRWPTKKRRRSLMGQDLIVSTLEFQGGRIRDFDNGVCAHVGTLN